MLVKSSKQHIVAAHLASLKINKVVSIQDLIDTILQVCNQNSATSDCFKFINNTDYKHLSEGQYVLLKDLYVDMSYQRRIRLAKILNKLKKQKGFDINVAGAIDVALRPSGDKFVWDGLRRCLMVGMCGGDRIPVSLFTHESHLYDDECKKVEAKFFKIRSADSEKMALEEVFKSMVAYEDNVALSQLKLLKDCGLDVEGLNPEGKQLGGLKAFQEIFAKIPHEIIVKASQIYQNAWNSEAQVLGYGLAGLATLMNDSSFENHYDLDEMKIKLREYALNGGAPNKPNTITNPRVNSAAFKSIAYNIAKKVLKDNNGLKTSLLSDEDIDLMESF